MHVLWLQMSHLQIGIYKCPRMYFTISVYGLEQHLANSYARTHCCRSFAMDRSKLRTLCTTKFCHDPQTIRQIQNSHCTKFSKISVFSGVLADIRELLYASQPLAYSWKGKETPLVAKFFCRHTDPVSCCLCLPAQIILIYGHRNDCYSPEHICRCWP